MSLGPAPIPGAGGGRPALPLIRRPTRRTTTLSPGASAQAGFDFASKGSASAPSLWDQVSSTVAGLPGGLIDLGVEGVQSGVGAGRLIKDVGENVVRGRNPGEGFSTDYGSNLGEYFPLLETFRQSGSRTVHRVTHPQEYVEAAKRGEIVPAVLEDVANASIIAGPAAKTLTAASGAERAAVAGAERGLASRFFAPSEAVAETAARPRLLRAGQAVERAAKPAEMVATAPARIWTAPARLLKGVELPERIFGTTAEGAARTVGVKPLLDRTGVTERVLESPTGRAAREAFTNWRDERAQLRDVRENYLLPQAAELHVGSDELDKALAPARDVLGGDVDLEYANHLVRTGQEQNLRVLRQLRDTLPEEQYTDLVAKTYGREQMPTNKAIDTALEYIDGRLDPAVRSKLDRAWELESKALSRVEEMKLAGEGRGPLNPEQVGDQPMASRIEARVGTLEGRAAQLRGELYGGENRPGLTGDLQAAQRLVPEPDMAQLAGQRAQTAARRAGVLEGERLIQARTAERATAGAEKAGARATQANLGTLEGARSAMADLQRERYGMGQYQSEWTATQRQIGETERAAGPPAPRYTVPDDELALAQHIGPLEGHQRTIPAERASGVAGRAQGRADVAGQRATAAEGRVFTGAAEPIFAPGRRGELPFGQMSDAERGRLSPMSNRDATSFVREIRTRVRDQVREQRQTMEANLAGDGAPYRIPRPGSGERDVYDAVQQELGGTSSRFRNMGLWNGERTVSLFGRNDRFGAGFDALLDRYGAGTDGIVAAQEALVADIRAVKEMKAVEGAIIRDGLEGGRLREFVQDPVEAAALEAGDATTAARNVQLAHVDLVLPEPQYGPAPWSMSRDAYTAELGDVQETLASVSDLPYEQWTPEVMRAESRMLELTPEVIDAQGLTADALHDRIREVAQMVGREVPDATAGDLARAEQAGRGALDEAHMLAQDAAELDPLTREAARKAGREVDPNQLIHSQLTPEERLIYRRIVDEGTATAAQDRLGAARARVTAGIRAEGERAGRRVGAAEGQERLLSRQAGQAGDRAEALIPRAQGAAERAQQVAEEDAGQPLRFGERRGKRIRDVQILERELRTKEGKLRWLEEERIPAEQARLAQGPREVAPGKYVPALATGERLRTALQQMADDLAASTGDWTLGGKFWREMQDIPTTMAELHARGILPEYLTGAVDEPTRGAPTIAGAQEQLPYEGPTPSEHRKTYGHVPQKIRTLQRSLVKEMAAIVRNKTADRLRADYARAGTDILNELEQRGELSPTVAEGLRTHGYDRSIDLAKEMERHDYTAWDPESPQGSVSDRQVSADSFFIPSPIAREFQRWWKPASRNPLVRGYDLATRGFKTSVLALSPSWQVNNILGNAFQSVVFGGESPATIARITREVLRETRASGRDLRAASGVEPKGPLSRLMAATPGVRTAREYVKDVARGQSDLPPRLFGSGQAAEISRQFAEHNEPSTALGRGVHASYRLNETIDNIGRSAVYLAKRGRGFSEEEAVGMALRAMGDFSNMSAFERDVVRRVVPFYAWMRHITQASYHLVAEHPWRTAWLLHMSAMLNPQDPSTPDWLRGALNVGGGWYVPFAGANPLQGNAGSLFTSPKNWPGEIMRSLNPVLKLGGASIGVNLAQGRAVTRPPGTGPTDQFGAPMWTFQPPNEIAYMAARMLPQGRLITDLLQEPVVRYDTGQPVKRLGRSIPLEGGRGPLIARDLSLPFIPAKVDEPAIRARIIKGQRALITARRNYNR